MKKKRFRIIIICLYIGLLTGCNNSTSTEEAMEYQNATPKTESFNIVSETGQTTIKVAAQVIVPDADKIPVVKLKKKDFLNEDLKWYTEQLFDEPSEIEYARKYDEMTKAELQELIRRGEEYLQDIRMLSDYYTNEERQFFIAKCEKTLEKLQEYYKNAPETLQSTPVTYKFTENNELKEMGIKARMFYVRGERNEREVNLYIEKGEKENSLVCIFETFWSAGLFQGYFDGYKNRCDYREQDAVTECENNLKIFGLEKEFELAEVLPTKVDDLDHYIGYKIIYKRKVNGFVETYDEQSSNVKMNYEKIIFEFGLEGLIEFSWTAPMEIEKVEAEDVELISYDRVIEIFKQQVFSRSRNLSQKENENSTYSIGKIVLGLMRVSNPDNPEEFSLIPVWDFYSTEDVKSFKSFLTINAIDGSIVDRNRGY